MDINQTRRTNLRLLISEASKEGTVAEFSRIYDVDASYISQLLNKRRGFGEKSARNFEAKLGLQDLYLDRPVDHMVMEEKARYLASQAGPGALAILEHYLKASPEIKAGAARLLGVPEPSDK